LPSTRGCVGHSPDLSGRSTGTSGRDAHFGSTGDHKLHLVTTNDLGEALIAYYFKVVQLNLKRRERLAAKLSQGDTTLLGGDYPGIPLTGLPKGISSEASVGVAVARRP
jgi:hypothetical protein